MVVSQLGNEFLTFYGTRRFVTGFTWAASVLVNPHTSISWRPVYIIILCMPRYSKWSRSLRYPYQNPVCTSSLYMLHVPLISFFSIWSFRQCLMGSMYGGASPNIFPLSHLLPNPFRPKCLLQCVYRMRMQFFGSKDSIEIYGLLATELVLWKNIIYKVEIIRSCISTEGPTLKQLIASLSNYVALNG